MDDLFPDRVLTEQALTRGDVERLLASSPYHLIDCDLDEADLSGLNLSRWKFERCSFRRCDFSRGNLEGTVWQSCRGAFANFTGSDLSEAVLIASDFNNASFKYSTPASASFSQCKLTGADLSGVKAADVHFDETLLVNAKIPEHSFRKERLRRIDFSQCDLRKCDFRLATFEECSLRDADMDGSRFEGADLRGADLGGLRLADAGLFRGATISREQATQILSELGINVR